MQSSDGYRFLDFEGLKKVTCRATLGRLLHLGQARTCGIAQKHWRRTNSISKAIVSLLPSPCRAAALSAARRLDTIDLEMEYGE